MDEQLKAADDVFFRISVDGTEVLGWVGGGERNITVNIHEPYVGLTDALHCAHFDRRLFIGEHRDKTARRLLENLYDVGQFLESNRDILRAFYMWYCVNWTPDFGKCPPFMSILSGKDDFFGEVGRYVRGELRGLAWLRVVIKVRFWVNVGLWRLCLNEDFCYEIFPGYPHLPIFGEWTVPRIIMGRRKLLAKKVKDVK